MLLSTVERKSAQSNSVTIQTLKTNLINRMCAVRPSNRPSLKEATKAVDTISMAMKTPETETEITVEKKSTANQEDKARVASSSKTLNFRVLGSKPRHRKPSETGNQRPHSLGSTILP